MRKAERLHIFHILDILFMYNTCMLRMHIVVSERAMYVKIKKKQLHSHWEKMKSPYNTTTLSTPSQSLQVSTYELYELYKCVRRLMLRLPLTQFKFSSNLDLSFCL